MDKDDKSKLQNYIHLSIDALPAHDRMYTRCDGNKQTGAVTGTKPENDNAEYCDFFKLDKIQDVAGKKNEHDMTKPLSPRHDVNP